MSAGAPLLLAGIMGLTTAHPAHPIEPQLAEALAEDTAATVESALDLPLSGEAARAATGLMLIGLAFDESAFRTEVDDCRVRGKLGEITAWQLIPGPNWGKHSDREICANRRLAASLALAVLVRARKQTRTVTGLFRAYTSGKPWVDSTQARDRDRTFGSVCKSAHVQMRGVIADWSMPAWLASYADDS